MATTTWQIDPGHTHVEFQAKHLVFTNVRGRLTNTSGTIMIDDDDLTRSTATVELDAASFDTGVADRDTHIRSADFLDVANHPKITFKSTRIEAAGDQNYRVTGDLTIRGVTRPIVLAAVFNGRVKSPWNTEVASFSAETTISRKDFGSTWNVALEAGGLLVSDAVKISIETEAIKQ